MDLLISFIPVVVILVMIIGFKVRGDIAGVVGWVLTLAIAAIFFNTGLDIGLIASLKGAIASLAVTMMGFFALLQITFMQETGALDRAVVAIKCIVPGDKAANIMIVNVIIGTALVAVGATPAVILPPLMFALGYSTVISIVLPCIGYDSLCTFGLLAAPVVALTDILTGAGFTIDGAAPTVAQVGCYFANYLPIVTPCICFAMLMMAGGGKLVKQGIVPALITGLGMGCTAFAVNHLNGPVVLTGVIAAAVTFCLMLIYVKAKKLKLYDDSILSDEDREIEKSMSIWKALSPWILLIIFCLLTNFIPPLYDLLYSGVLECRVKLFVGDSGQAIRPFWNAWFWVFVSTIVASVFILKPKKGTWGSILKKWNKRWLPPTLSSIIYFCIAYVMMYSSYAATGDGGAWVMVDQTKNIISLWATSAADAFGWFYPIANGFLGLLAGFVTGSETSAVALFAKYNLLSSEILGLNPLVVIASGGIAAGLASVITPVKLQQAASSIDKIGEEGSVMRKVLPYALALVAVSVVLSQIFAVVL